MGPSDLNLLLDMGFDKQRAELAVKKTGGRASGPYLIKYCFLIFIKSRVPYSG